MSQTWTIDASHSSVDFKVRHMGLSSVRGSFSGLEGTALMNEGVLSAIELSFDAASIDTRDEKRDAHLRSADFFDSETYPKISFKSNLIEAKGAGEYNIKGDLTIRDSSQPVTFNATIAESLTDPWGLTRAAANVQGKLNRKDWGLTWNQVLEAGALLVGEEVSFDFDVQATQAS